MKIKHGLDALTASFFFLSCVLFLPSSGSAIPGKTDSAGILKDYGRLPLLFIENKGQLDPEVRFYVKTSSQTLYFTDEEIVFDFLRREKDVPNRTLGVEKGRPARGTKRERLVFNLRFENARKGVLIKGLEPQTGKINYFVGNDRSKWKTRIPTYKAIVYKEVYSGIDLKVFGEGEAIEYEFIVNPGANPNDILLTYNGIEGLSTNGEGELLIETTFGQLKETRPYIYQEIEGERMVDGRFDIKGTVGQSKTGKFSYGFQVSSYDHSRPLIIDPTLTYSTYLGTSNNDEGSCIAVDGSGNAYVTGRTNSTHFPTKNPYQGTLGDYPTGEYDAFVTKLSASGSTLLYSTYLGGSDWDSGHGVAVDGSGNAYVTGYTESKDFPTQNSYQGTYAGGYWDAFITKLSASGSTLLYSTYLGGSWSDGAHSIAVDGIGNAYVTGYTNSTDFPTQYPYQKTKAGLHVYDNCDAFITKLSASGTALHYSTYLGGSKLDEGNAIAIDRSGNAYVAGETFSTDFPTKSPYQGAYIGTDYPDVFITKLSASGTALYYSTYLGGIGEDWLSFGGIAVDGSGNAYVTGETSSPDFPTKNAYQGTMAQWEEGEESDAFITKFSTSGTTVHYSTYLGGRSSDGARGIAVDGSENAYVTGRTSSSDFPMQNPYQGTNAGGFNDAFITKISASGKALYYSTYLGGSNDDDANAIAVDGAGNAYIAGVTRSTDFPTKNSYQGTYGGGIVNTDYDAFVTKFDMACTLYVNKDGSCGGNTPCHTSIQVAIEAAESGSAIKIAQGNYSESITLNTSKSVVLQGGWNTSYDKQTSNSTFIETPKAPKGSLTLQMVTVKP